MSHTMPALLPPQLVDRRRRLHPNSAAGCLPPTTVSLCTTPPLRSYLSWDDYFMAVAFLSAQRSKDPNKQAGGWPSPSARRLQLCTLQSAGCGSTCCSTCSWVVPRLLPYLHRLATYPSSSQVGACIVDANNVICGIGYNGFPRGCADSSVRGAACCGPRGLGGCVWLPGCTAGLLPHHTAASC